jgi:hypothetical protein
MAPNKSLVLLAALLLLLTAAVGQAVVGLPPTTPTINPVVIVSGVTSILGSVINNVAVVPPFASKDTALLYILYKYICIYTHIIASDLVGLISLSAVCIDLSGRPDATVQVVCNSTVVATATTDSNGAFTIILGRILSMATGVVTSLLSNQCRAVVTPNVSLGGATGTLSVPLQPVSTVTTLGGLVTATTITVSSLTATAFNGIIALLGAV